MLCNIVLGSLQEGLGFAKMGVCFGMIIGTIIV